MVLHRKLKKIVFFLILLFVSAITTGLGFWQLQRGFYKQRRLEELAFRIKQPAQPLEQVAPLELDQKLFLSIVADGAYLDNPVILLDNYIYNKQPGYALFNVF